MSARLSWRDIPTGVWALGAVSFLMDLSSEQIHALLPLLLVNTLGTSVAVLGVIEGVSEAATAFTKLLSGRLSDRLGRRKALALAGYALAAATKPAFPLAGSAGTVFAARFIDRIGKGVRGAPRDALVADITPPVLRGAAYGLRQALDSIGAFAGPLLAVLLMALYADRIRSALWCAVLPALGSVALLACAVRDPGGLRRASRRSPVLPRRTDLATLGRAFWTVVAIGALLTLARSSEAFLILAGQRAGLPLTLVPMALVCMNAAYAAGAWPAGSLSDRIGRRGLLQAGLVVLAAADIALALARGPAGLFVGAALWGLHMALSQGLLSALIADTAPETLRGSAFGLFNLVAGAATLLASLFAGLLWQWVGPAATFGAGAVFACWAALVLTWLS